MVEIFSGALGFEEPESDCVQNILNQVGYRFTARGVRSVNQSSM